MLRNDKKDKNAIRRFQSDYQNAGLGYLILGGIAIAYFLITMITKMMK